MADADVQGLLIRIEATTAQLRQELAAGESAVAKAASQIDRSLGSADSAFDRLGKKAQATTTLIRGAMAGIAGAGLIGGLIKQADAYGQMADRMRAATSSSSEYEMVQKHILTTAQETYRPLHEAQELYIRTADVMKGLGYDTQRTLNITDSFSYLLVTNAASADKAGTALDAYSKSLQTGKIDADSWVSIMTAMPTVAEAVANATGRTSKEIRKLGAEGKLGLSDLNLGLEQVRDSAQKAAAAMSTSVMDALNNINNAIGAYIGEANESTSATGELAKVLDLVAKNIDIVAAAGAGLVAAGVTGYMLKNSVAAWNSVTAMVAEAKATRDSAAAKVEATAASAALAAAQAIETSAVVVGARSTEASAVAKLRVIQAARDQLAYAVALSKGTQEEARYTAALAATDIELAAAKKAAFAASTQLGIALNAESAAMAKDAAATAAASSAKKEYAAVSSLAARAGSGLLALLGGPVGIAALAVGAGVAFLTMRDSTDQAAISLDEMKAPLDQVIAKFKTLNEDQRKAALVRWGEAQAKAAQDVASEFGNLATSIRSATVDPSQARLGGYSVQLREYTALIERLKEAQASGQALTPILEGLRGKAGINDAEIDSWVKQAGVVSDAGGVLKEVTLKLNEQTGALSTNTAETIANNTAKASMSAAGTTYLETLQKQLAGLQDGGDVTKIVNRHIQEHSELTETDKVALLSAASAIEANKEATKQATAAKKTDNDAAKEAATEAKNQAKALTDLQTQADIAIKSATGLATAYLAGTDKAREFTLQQKVEEALLKAGAGARKEVEKAINAQQDAQDKLNISKAGYDLGKETADIIAQAQATLMGADALAAYNVQKSMTVALAGKNIAVGSEEYKQLLAATEAHQEAVKVAQRAASAGGIMERLYPEAKLLKDYTEDQKALNAAMGLYPENAANYQAALLKLGNEYEVNRSKATLWGQMTEGAIDRIDEAFASAWGNIGSGAESLWDNLKKGFKQTLGEIAHMLTTKPLLASISNWLTGADNGQGLSSVWGKLLGGASGSSTGGGGGMMSSLTNAGSMLYKLYSAVTGVGSSVASGWASGGLGGAINGGYSYYANLFSGLTSSLSSGFSSVVGSILGSSSSQIAANAATSAALQGAVAQGAATVGTNIGIGGAAYAGAGTAAAGISGGLGAQFAAMASNPVGWVVAAVTAAYQSGKIYDKGYRYDMMETLTDKNTLAAGGILMEPAFNVGITDKVFSKLFGGKIAAILSGSALFGSVLGTVSSKLFGGKWQTKDGGLSLGVQNGEFDGQQYIYQKKKGGLFSSSKKRTRYSALEPEFASALHQTYEETEDSVAELLARIGVSVGEGAFSGLTIARQKISTKGKTQDEIQAAINEMFSGFADQMVAHIDQSALGLGGSFSELAAKIAAFESFNATLDLIDVTMLRLSPQSMELANALVAAAGGLETYAQSLNTYFEGFFSDSERADKSLGLIQQQFKDMNLTLPDTRVAYRKVVEALDLTTEAGQSMYLTLIGAAGSAAQAYDILEAKANAAAAGTAQQLQDGLSNALSAVQRAVSAQQKKLTEAYNATNSSLNDMVSTVTEKVNGLSAVSVNLSSALKALRGDSDDAVKMLRAQAQATLQSALVTARSGKSLSGFTGLEDALNTVSNNNTDLYGSLEDFNRDQGRTANVVAELNGINGKQLTAAEKSLEGLKTQIDQAKKSYDLQMSQYDAQLTLAQAQIDALNGVDNSVVSVAAAVNSLSQAVVASLAIKGDDSARQNTFDNNAAIVRAVYRTVLGRDADAKGLADWAGALSGGLVTYDELMASIARQGRINGENVLVPGFASGGVFSGGLRLVGERGPELEVTGPSRIYNASQTAAMLNGGGSNAGLVTEIRALGARLDMIQAETQAGALNGGKIVKLLDRVTDGGNAMLTKELA